jgi:hypothetical protein
VNVLIKLSGLLILAGTNLSCIMRSDLKSSKKQTAAAMPRLVVLLVVDQMRSDFIGRFSSAFRKNSDHSDAEGLLYLAERGTTFMNARTASAPTVTATGHATVCSGATASQHGIVANMFFDRKHGIVQEAAADSTTQVVRTPSMLPNDPLSRVESASSSEARLMTPSISDALHDWSGGQSKTFSVSIKDRGAVFCGGKHSLGVYWYDYQSGTMVTSSRYKKELPEWVNMFNKNRAPNFNFIWKPSFSLATLKTYITDSHYKQALEVRSSLSVKYGTGFPYEYNSFEIGALGARKFFEYTPYASEHLVDFALEAQKQEKLGCALTSDSQNCKTPQFPDFLTVSFSTPDLVGHAFGPESLEHFDIYLNLNKSVERLRRELEDRLGSGNVLFIQTSDHGVQTLPEVTQSVKGRSAGRFSSQAFKTKLDELMDARYGSEQWIDEVINGQIYFNFDSIRKHKLTTESVIALLKPDVVKFAGVLDVLSAEEIAKGGSEVKELYKRGLQPERSGDAFILMSEGWLIESSVAGNHGTSNEDDTRIPLIFYGWRIPQQVLDSAARADDIAPTVLTLLGSKVPSFMTGKSLRNQLIK